MELLVKIPAPAWLLFSALFFALGEYLSKLWGDNPSWRGALLVVAAYAVGTLGWLPALLHKNQLAVMGTAWLLLATVATVVIGVFVFGEALNRAQWTGVVFATISLFLLSR